MFKYLPLLLFVCVLFGSEEVAAQHKIPKRTKLPAALKEVSGMVKMPNGDLWLLNDSHNPPELFRYDLKQGKLLETRKLPLVNHDWEDLTTDNKGNLFIGDFGNNYNKRKDLRVYTYNPASGKLDSILFTYPDQTQFAPTDKHWWNYNCEAMVYMNDSLHLFSKNSFQGNFYSKHYVIPARAGTYTAELRDSFLVKDRVVTGAALSHDGKTLAFTAYIIGKHFGFLPYTRANVYYVTGFKGSNFMRGKVVRKRLPKFILARQFESVTQWEGDQWIIANEGRKPQFQSIWRAKKAAKSVK